MGFLARTGRRGPARTLTTGNHQICTDNGGNDSAARCERILTHLDLTHHDPVRLDHPGTSRAVLDGALERVRAAAGAFRGGEYLAELAETLPVLADAARAVGDLEAAERAASEAIDLAGPHGLILAHTAALTARAASTPRGQHTPPPIRRKG